MVAHYMDLGGPLMWPLLACSIALGAVLFERAWTIGIRGFGLGLVPAAMLGAHRRVLNFMIDIPPALGLLGTVQGVIECFSLLDGEVASEGLGQGLAVACITTVAGLIIAIVASVAMFFLDLADAALLEQIKQKGAAS